MNDIYDELINQATDCVLKYAADLVISEGEELPIKLDKNPEK